MVSERGEVVMIIKAKKILLKNSSEMVLKSPSAEDAENLLSHLKNCFHQSYRNMNHPKNHWDNFLVGDEEKVLTDFELAANKFMISAFFQDKIIGNLGCFSMAGEHIKHNARVGMGIEEAFHGIGLGRALMEYAILNARDFGFSRLELTVRAFNQAGINLYERVGFQRVGLTRQSAFIEGQYFDEYIYELII